MELFTQAASQNKAFLPLAERMRPNRLEDIIGQEHLLAVGKPLRTMLSKGSIPSLILWGPPGCGKTTLARLIAKYVQGRFEQLSAVMSGVKELRKVVGDAEDARAFQNKRTFLFIDEIHRFNKSQQDALLPHVESGLITLIGATTENPSFEVNPALLSRCRVFVLELLSHPSLGQLVQRATGALQQTIDDDALQHLVQCSEGDARRALSLLETCAGGLSSGQAIHLNDVQRATEGHRIPYDKQGEHHYQVVSAFIKAMRGSSQDGAVYWLTRMLEGGEDPKFIIRRMLIFAAEDIGNVDPQALVVMTAAAQAFDRIGLPEGVLPLTQAALYLAKAPKSNIALTAYAKARTLVRQHGALPVPKHLVNAPTTLMKAHGFGKGYKYPHNFDGLYLEEQALPENIKDEVIVSDSAQVDKR